MYIYSAKTNGFYPVDWKQHYIDAGSWPDDGIVVSDQMYREFALTPPSREKIRVAGSNGLPVWGKMPPLTQEELQQEAEAEKRRLLSLAKEKIAIWQDAIDLDMATNEEKAALLVWKKYRVLLNRVDCTNAPGIDWPEQPE
ncbi:tail fiber assembly protein [Xenorhabdus sp. Flor]|uniref:tail fiber assembly protein n=1 Tax=Xenorhabdus cabanillasii TaxID=351673 RepID=UPI0019B6F69D|nr:tail fiber assembly protein [Xenorhabdus sp. Flor]MBD2815321.1 tail fiber assembly protein [Xenorhabdus sp. Flor]